jgi:hypothetical protein
VALETFRRLGAPPWPTLAAEELTILASWTQAAAEALTFGPERIRAVIADTRAGAPWRAELGIREPSLPLQHSISGTFRAVYQGAAASSGLPSSTTAPLTRRVGSNAGSAGLDT